MIDSEEINVISSEAENKSQLNVKLFERTTPNRLVRKKSKFSRYKLKVFCALHWPVSSWHRYYHYTFIAIVMIDCIVINVFDEYFRSHAVIIMAFFDLILTGVLTTELILRFWSSDCKFNGKLEYFKAYSIQRAFDFCGILTFMAFICYQSFTGYLGIILRLLHIFQVCHLYRLLMPLLKLMISTIVDQFHQLYIALVFMSIILVLMSFSIYLREMSKMDYNMNLFDAFWFGYITLSTIGYGDITPKTIWGKVLTCILAFCGICMFQLPPNIFGTGLAIKLREQQKYTLFRTPASKLIQTIWRCYATDSDSKLIAVWNTFRKDSNDTSDTSDTSDQPLTQSDKQCIRFILKIQYISARTHFNFELNPKTYANESVEQLELLRRVSHLEIVLSDLREKTIHLKHESDLITEKILKLLTQMDSF